jgi:hypothetical protein
MLIDPTCGEQFATEQSRPARSTKARNITIYDFYDFYDFPSKMTSENIPESSTEHTERPEQPERRRRRESDLQELRPLPLRMRELPAYYGKDIQEAQDFISGAERRFRLDRGYYYPDDTSKIDYCVLAFESKPYCQWSVFEEDAGGPGYTIWEQFKAYLFESICDIDNRQMSAMESYKNAYQ